SLEQLLDCIGKANTSKGQVSLGAILEAVGSRSFGPLLLVAGLIILAPFIGGIPGVPTTMATLVLLSAGQLLFRREQFWLPRWLLKRSVARDKLCRGLKWLRRPAQFLDRLTRPRLSVFTQGAGIYVIAIACIAIAAVTPVMEFVPFSANGAGAALTAFGLALLARDGFLALLALLVTASMFVIVVYSLLWFSPLFGTS
ncbi:MAG TPA: exopolysaccharide biosynthesis protein, partial [Gammaproteobacteria bacterium]|nr:exopolysaccharide biosynthesis protein [Gammaproteobacteria bacterium]